MELTDVAKLLKTQETEDLLSFGNVISTLSNDNVKTKLHDFEVFLLPYILGEVERTDTNSAVYIDNILRITKSHHIGVDVVDNDNNIMFKIPALISDTDITKLDSVAFGSIVSKVNMYTESQPGKASLIMKKVSEAVLRDLDISNDGAKDLLKIYTHYMDRVKVVMDKKGIDIKTVTKEVDDVEEDLFEY